MKEVAVGSNAALLFVERAGLLRPSRALTATQTPCERAGLVACKALTATHSPCERAGLLLGIYPPRGVGSLVRARHSGLVQVSSGSLIQPQSALI